MLFSYFLLFFFLSGQTVYSDEESNLLCSMVIFREGERTPLSLQESDPYKEKWQAEGLGVLTKIGERKMYKFGQFIQSRYKQQLSEKTITRNSFSVRSVKYDRHISSAKMVLKGLFSSFPSSINLGQISIVTKPPDADSLMMTDSCPAYDKEVEKCMNEDETFSKVDEEEKSFYSLIQEHTKCSVNSFPDVKMCIDPLFCEASEGLGLPSWCNQTCYDHMLNLLDLDWKLEVSNPKLLNLKLQPFVNEMLTKIESYVYDIQKQFTLNLFSSVGYTLPSLMKSIGVENYDLHVPKFGDSIFVELRRLDTKKVVNLFYMSASDGSMKQLSIKGCGMDCEYSELLQLIPPLLKRRRLPCGI